MLSDVNAHAELARSISQVALTTFGKHELAHARLVIGEETGQPCVFEVSPLVDSLDELGVGFRGAMVTLIDPLARLALDPGLLSDTFGLIWSEATVASMVVDGLTNAEIASKRGVSIETTKSQVAAILNKTSSRNRVELVRRLVVLALPLRA